MWKCCIVSLAPSHAAVDAAGQIVNHIYRVSFFRSKNTTTPEIPFPHFFFFFSLLQMHVRRC